MHDSVAKRGGADQPSLRLVDGEAHVRAPDGTYGFQELLLQLQQVIRQWYVKPGSALPSPFASGGVAVSFEQVLP